MGTLQCPKCRLRVVPVELRTGVCDLCGTPLEPVSAPPDRSASLPRAALKKSVRRSWLNADSVFNGIVGIVVLLGWLFLKDLERWERDRKPPRLDLNYMGPNGETIPWKPTPRTPPDALYEWDENWKHMVTGRVWEEEMGTERSRDVDALLRGEFVPSCRPDLSGME